MPVDVPLQPLPPPQPGSVIAEVEGSLVLALAAPQFAALSREQRLVAYWAAQGIGAGTAGAIDQGYRRNLEIVRVLRGILSRPEVIPPGLVQRVRAFARLVYLNRGIHDAETGRKLLPTFTAADLRLAALAAQAAGADLGLSGARPEYALRALEGPLFDPRVDAQRTVHGSLMQSAVNLYAGVSERDLNGFHEQYPQNSRLAKSGGALVEQVYRLPAAADGLDQALSYIAPPQRAVIEPLSAFFRSGDPGLHREAQRAWLEAAGPIDFFAGFLDASSDPRARKGIYEGFVGAADPERTALLQRMADGLANAPRTEALVLVAAAGAMRPMRDFGFTAATGQGAKSAVFAAAAEAAAQLGEERWVATLAEPNFAGPLSHCGSRLRLAFLALRESAGKAASADESGALREALADLAAHQASAGRAAAPLLGQQCRNLWPRYVVTSWLASAADLPDADKVESDRLRAIELQLWWFTAKGAVAERYFKGRRYLSVTDDARFFTAAGELARLLRDIERSGDLARIDELFALHAAKVDVRLRDEVRERLRAAGVARRVLALPPRLDPVVQDGKVVDALAFPITDLDDQIQRDWAGL